MFNLHKWYFDCVTANGTSFIGYAATFRLFGVSACYCGYLLSDGENVREQSSWSGATLPIVGADDIDWSCPRLQLTGRWHGHIGSDPHTLYEHRHGTVLWHCCQPSSSTSLKIGDVTLEGRGYVEQLHLTIAPWKLPIDELLWGRFVGTETSIVWIEWRGPQPFILVLENGVQCLQGQIHDAAIDTDCGHLKLHEPRTLRYSSLDNTLRHIPLLGGMLARRFGATTEHKLLCPATYHHSDGSTESGWVIHEIVQWQRDPHA